jgi:hypothetical protein
MKMLEIIGEIVVRLFSACLGMFVMYLAYMTFSHILSNLQEDSSLFFLEIPEASFGCIFLIWAIVCFKVVIYGTDKIDSTMPTNSRQAGIVCHKLLLAIAVIVASLCALA